MKTIRAVGLNVLIFLTIPVRFFSVKVPDHPRLESLLPDVMVITEADFMASLKVSTAELKSFVVLPAQL